MSEINAAVEVLDRPGDAEHAIRKLCEAGFDQRRLSVVAVHRRMEECGGAVPFPDIGLHSGIAARSFWEGIRRLLHGWGCFEIPRIGVVLAAGPLAGWMHEAQKNQGIFCGLSCLGAGLCSIGIPRNLVPFYEAELKAGGFLLIAHGSSKDVVWARSVLDNLAKRNERESTSATFRGNARGGLKGGTS